MKITDEIRRVFTKAKDSVLYRFVQSPAWAFDPFEHRLPFGRIVWLNIVELLTSLANDVTFKMLDTDNVMLFAEFRKFYDTYGEEVLIRLFDDGAVVIGHGDLGFRILQTNEYYTTSSGTTTVVKTYDPTLQVYVMKSPTFEMRGVSDRVFCNPFLEYIDNTLNASNTCSARLGALIVGSPSQSSSMPTPTVLTKEQKKEIEENLTKEYGALSNQKQFLLLPRSMNFQTVNLASIDMRTAEKVRLAILAICDRIKVPANQVAIIDANSGKSLSNGSELREGDFNKYQAFERLLNRSFVKMANEAGLRVDYTIYNKPSRTQI